jgi:hypothetical protein
MDQMDQMDLAKMESAFGFFFLLISLSGFSSPTKVRPKSMAKQFDSVRA